MKKTRPTNDLGGVRNDLGGARNELGDVRNDLGDVRNDLGGHVRMTPRAAAPIFLLIFHSNLSLSSQFHVL